MFNTSFSRPINLLFFLKFLFDDIKKEIGIKIDNKAPWTKLALTGNKSNEFILIKIEFKINDTIYTKIIIPIKTIPKSRKNQIYRKKEVPKIKHILISRLLM